MYPLHAYQHQSDRDGFVHLKGLNWISLVSKKFISSDMEDDFYLLNLMDNIKMDARDFPEVHAYLDEACQVLGIVNFEQTKPIIIYVEEAETAKKEIYFNIADEEKR